MSVELVGTSGPPGRFWHYLAPVALFVLIAAVIAVVLTIPGRSSAQHRISTAAHAATHRLPPYWVVRANDTLSEIALKTGLSINQLQAFNPQVDPNNLLPGTRLNLWQHPPVPRRPPPGPMFWTVRPGQSFGSIADKTGINIDTLETLNPRIKPASLQPGERLRLRS